MKSHVFSLLCILYCTRVHDTHTFTNTTHVDEYLAIPSDKSNGDRVRKRDTEFRVSNDGQPRNGSRSKAAFDAASMESELGHRVSSFVLVSILLLRIVGVGLAAAALAGRELAHARTQRTSRSRTTYPIAEKRSCHRLRLCGQRARSLALISLLLAKWRWRRSPWRRLAGAAEGREGRGDRSGVSGDGSGTGSSSKGLRIHCVARQSLSW